MEDMIKSNISQAASALRQEINNTVTKSNDVFHKKVMEIDQTLFDEVALLTSIGMSH